MTTTINASTSSGLVVTPDNSGNIVLQYNGVAAPAFSAYGSTNQNISTGTWTKVQLNAENFDTANCFDSTTNYRFTPTVAGYYQINGSVYFNGTSTVRGIAGLYKNGSIYQMGNYMASYNNTQGVALVISLVYFNGSTDYIELYGLIQATSPQFLGDQTALTMSGYLVRGA